MIDDRASALKRLKKDQLSEMLAIDAYKDEVHKSSSNKFSPYVKKRIMYCYNKSQIIQYIIEDDIQISVLYGYDNHDEYRDDTISKLI